MTESSAQLCPACACVMVRKGHLARCVECKAEAPFDYERAREFMRPKQRRELQAAENRLTLAADACAKVRVALGQREREAERGRSDQRSDLKCREARAELLAAEKTLVAAREEWEEARAPTRPRRTP